MKKVMMGIVACLSLMLLTGCGNEQKTMNCSRTMNQSGASIDLKYEVLYTGAYVDVVKSKEKITSDDEELLETYRKNVETQYAPYKDVEHYVTNVSIDGNVLTSTADIDYTKIDTSKMIEIDSANGSLIQDGKVKLETIKSLYESLGITCEK